ncbi:MAG: hypothetical protein J6B80_06885 [Clostridia bacterium]|nr:hypothetical protein [Clostridia bacterium]
MVILLSDRKSKYEKEIIEILKKYGGQHISDKFIGDGNSKFTILSIYKKSEWQLSKGVVVFLDEGNRFSEQKIPISFIGVCDENNTKALTIFKKNKISAICCGLGNKNSITLSSLGNNSLFACLQRNIQNTDGEIIEQGELKIKLTKNYLPFSIMASVAILLLNGITPVEF